MEKQDKRVEKIEIKSEIAKVSNEGFKASKPSVSIKYPENIHLETKCMLKGTDQAPNKEAVSKKGKEKMEHFGIELQDTRYEPDIFSPIHPSIKGTQTMNKDNQGMIKGPIKSEFEVKEETDSNSSEGFTIIV
ncbi:hypothetical protein Tco_1569055 [Tanacetum coccineum]